MKSKPYICVFLAIAIAMMPFNVNLSTFMDDGFQIDIEKNRSYAATPQPFQGARDFIEAMASQAGFSNSGDFVATVIGMDTVATGISLISKTNPAAARMGKTLNYNLSCLADAADYPAWDTLSSSQQTQWGSKENYDSAKFNALMNAFGMGSDYENFKQGWTGSGGGGFTFSSSVTDTLDKIGNIGANWLMGLPTVYEDIIDTYGNNNYENVIGNWLGGSVTYQQFDATGITGWPSGLPTNPYINKGNSLLSVGTGGSVYYLKVISSADVYWYIAYMSTSNSTYGSLNAVLFSKQGFMYGYYNGTNSNGVANATSAAATNYHNGQTYYYTTVQLPYDRWTNTEPQTTMRTNGIYTSTQVSSMRNAAGYILFSDQLDIGNQEKIEDYPQTINNNTNIFFPASGVDGQTPWESYTSSQTATPPFDATEIMEVLNKFSFYNVTSQLKVHDEGVYSAIGDLGNEMNDVKQVLTNIYSLLNTWFNRSNAQDVIGEFDFDEIEEKVPDLLEVISEVAPFGALALISEIVAVVSQVGAIQKPELRFPWKFGITDQQQYEVIVDLTWMDDLKEVYNFGFITLLILGLLYASYRIVELEAAT